ncbi:protein-L-isoaspartate(D-aspartate) O-methyltransferase [Candidatus Paraluminiphilus aquimaris]|uniref:Protein-L-isoaspartate O-methyltransferase n=1 Tax=Candidatus Paraluminiphilus aquimaris TaxID=2518994 RepID=A0ABY6QBJ5_9GAMM|nr:protein-L-isoaspartate(D-aspartate) O-methyltransferase [Candidatus Paraluminiphilus aquimaris]UZP75601.1 protein-L-isoaspartate(D-aspartate) O-methyltransferase [Candidatus Paraluminiphilus aquimaris]
MTSQRTRMRLIDRLRSQGISDESVLDAMGETPRHLFVDEALAHRAYEDTALPIGFNQTLSQPYIVARMTELALQNGKPKRVLELGTGSGYQSAVLARVALEVFSIERIKPLLDKARQRLRALKARNVRCKHGDGFEGWAEFAPFDVILGAAAPETLPENLLSQLAPGGVLLLPVGGSSQKLIQVTLTDDGFEQTVVEDVFFVPMLEGVQR